MSVPSLTVTNKCQRPTPNFCQVKPTLLGQQGWATLCEEHWGQSGFHSLPLTEAQKFHHLVRVVCMTLPEVSKRLGVLSVGKTTPTKLQDKSPHLNTDTSISARLPSSAKGSSAEEMRVLTTQTGNRVLSGSGNHRPEDGYWSQSPLENRDFRTRLEILEPQSIHCGTGLTDIQ